MKKNNKGFSLVELVIVIAIMAILAAAISPAMLKYIRRARAAACIKNRDTIRVEFESGVADEQEDSDDKVLDVLDEVLASHGIGPVDRTNQEIIGLCPEGHVIHYTIDQGRFLRLECDTHTGEE